MQAASAGVLATSPRAALFLALAQYRAKSDDPLFGGDSDDNYLCGKSGRFGSQVERFTIRF